MTNIISNNKKLILGFVTATSIAASSVFALANLEKGASVGKTESEIKFALEKQNYVVEEIELEDGVYEVEVTLDNKEMEIEIDANTGIILEVELEGDGDHEEDKDDQDEDDDKDKS